MGNKAFKDYGQVPNYPVTSNDASHLIPRDGFGNYQGRHCYSHFQCGNSSTKSWSSDTTWYKKWSLPYIHGISETILTGYSERFGKGTGYTQNSSDNDRSQDVNPKGAEHFWSGTVPEEDKCALMSKPMGNSYKSWVTYYGDPINIDSEGNVWGAENSASIKRDRILPMGLSFSYQCWHEAESGLTSAYAKVQIQSLMMVVRSETGRFSLAELVNCEGDWYLKMASGSSNKGNMSEGQPRVPGKWKKYSGSRKPLHKMSEPGGGGSLSRSAQPPQTRVSGMLLGSYGHVYYEFSKKTQDYIVQHKCVPVGIMIKWGGVGSQAVYSAASFWCFLYDMQIISQQGFSPIDSPVRLDRIANPTRPWPNAGEWVQNKTIDGKQYMEFPLD